MSTNPAPPGPPPLDRAQRELAACIALRGTALSGPDRIGVTLGEMDWACEVLRLGGKLPKEFYQA